MVIEVAIGMAIEAHTMVVIEFASETAMDKD